MTWTLVQSAPPPSSGSVITFDAPPTPGNAIVVPSWIYPDGTLAAPTMTGNTLIKPPNLPYNTTASGGDGTLGIYTCVHESGASSSISFAEGSGATTTAAAEWSWSGGPLTSISIDGNAAIGDGIDGTSTDFSPADLDELLILYIATAGFVGSITGEGWTAIDVGLPQSGNGWAYQNGTLTPVTGTADQTSSDAGFIVGIKAGAASGSTTTADSVTPTDSVSDTHTGGSTTTADSVTPTDTAITGNVRNISDTWSISDTLTDTDSIQTTTADSVAPTDAVTIGGDMFITGTTDSVTPTDANITTSSSGSSSTTTSDSLTITDSNATSGTGHTFTTDTVTPADTLTTSHTGGSTTTSDAWSITDALGGTTNIKLRGASSYTNVTSVSVRGISSYSPATFHVG